MMDEKEFRELYNTYHTRLYYFSLKFTKSSYSSEEIVQEVFIKIWENRDKINPGLSFQSYIFTITRNAIINFLKKVAYDEKMKEEVCHLSDLHDSFTQEKEGISEYELILHQAIAKLPPKRQRIYKMAKIEGISYEEIAMNLCIAKSTVRLQIVEANKFVKDFVHNNVDHVFTASLVIFLFLDIN